MNRRKFLSMSVLGIASLAGCSGSSGGKFEGPDDEDQKYVDLKWRDYPDDEAEEIRSSAVDLAYSEVFRNIEDYEGKQVTFSGQIGQLLEQEDYFLFLIFVGGQVDQVMYVSWVGDRYIKGDYVELWGEVLGTETYETGAGSTATVPAIAVADMELISE